MHRNDPEIYKRLFYESPGAMYIYDHETYDFLAVNKTALYQYGYSEDEFLSMNATQIRPNEDVLAFDNANKIVPDDYYDFGERRHLRKNGEVFFVHIYARTINFNDRKARLVFAVDVDKKVKTELAIAEKNAEINNILESITDGFYAMNSNWEVIYFNKTAEKVLQCKREDVIGKVLWDFFPDSMEGSFYPKYKHAMEQRISVHFEEIYKPLGVWGDMYVYPTNDGIAVYFVDITEKKKIQDKIVLDEQNLRAIINNTNDIIWSIDKEYNIISANDAFWARVERMTNKPAHEIKTEDYGNELTLKWNNYFQHALDGNTYKIVDENDDAGRHIFEETSFNPIKDTSGNVIGVSCISRDITEHQNYLKKIEKQNEQLRQIAWIQSHEVRAPVASILGLVQLFNKEGVTNPLNAEIINKVQEATLALDEVIKRITAFTKIS